MEIFGYFQRKLRKLSLDNFRLIHSLKTALGCLIGLAFVYYYNWPSGQWVPITIMVVMSAQAHFGGALKKAYMRFLGTFSGVMITLLVLSSFGNNEVATFIAVFIAIAFFAYIASGGGDISYAGTLGGVTVLLTLTGIGSNIHYAIQRGLYIVVGIIIALLVSRLVFPIHARDQLRLSIARAIRDLKKLYIKTLEPGFKGLSIIPDDKLDSLLLANFEDQPVLIAEAAAGSRNFHNHKKTCYIEIIKIERKIYRLMYFMRMILQQDNWLLKVMSEVHGIDELNALIENGLDELANCFEGLSVIPSCKINLRSALKNISHITKKMPDEKNTQKLLDEHSLIFFLKQIVKEIEDLHKIIEQIAA